ncbi:hypothetical protein [Streptomyces sp. JJ38]|uniref:hypothetical protein n=1 Tax=Streptomyces sp. JJ38 TaxID=2738128 RepID=UPI0027DFB384|nr:hypothetical protein [Streptomyces sp. JJ38]
MNGARGSGMAGGRRMAGVRRGVAALLAGVALAGCGIRATPVPVDAGSAPSRVACGVRGGASGVPSEGASEVRVALVCSGRVVDVRRRLELPSGDGVRDRVELARTLLRELRRNPRDVEVAAGFTTAVPDDLLVEGPAAGDERAALRLSRPPSALPSFALAQLVCTFADTQLADSGRGILLGGPAFGTGVGASEGSEVRRYECSTALRTRTETAESAGVPL